MRRFFCSNLALPYPGFYPPSFTFSLKLHFCRGLDQNPLLKGESSNDSKQAKESNPLSICFVAFAPLKCKLHVWAPGNGPVLTKQCDAIFVKLLSLSFSPSLFPDGFTPLMIASCSGGGLETGNSEEEEDASANVINDFIYQGANLHNQTDRTGETALHLAARYARSDAAKRLLEASADANIQDNMGRTPLHAAVAADAQGVFQVGFSLLTKQISFSTIGQFGSNRRKNYVLLKYQMLAGYGFSNLRSCFSFSSTY